MNTVATEDEIGVARAGKSQGTSPKLAFLQRAVALGDDGIEQIDGIYGTSPAFRGTKLCSPPCNK